jgi:hypothetical protein
MNTRSSLKKDDLIKKEKEIRIKKMIKRYRDLVINLFLPGSFLFYKYNSYLGVFTTLWHTYYVVVVLMFYSKWHQVVNGNLFDFSMILFTLIELFFYIYTYFIMIKRR